jgi:hypothetical protein
MLCAVDGGAFFTYSEGDVDPQQNLIWLDESGQVMRSDTAGVEYGFYAFPSADRAMIVDCFFESGAPFSLCGVNIHSYDRNGTRYPVQRIVADTLWQYDYQSGRCFSNSEGALAAVYVIAQTNRDGYVESYRLSLVDCRPDSTRVLAGQFLQSLSEGSLSYYSRVAAIPGGGWMFAYLDAADNRGRLKYRMFDLNGLLNPRSKTDTLSALSELTGMDLLVYGGTVYNAYTTAVYEDPDQSGVYLRGFPVRELQLSGSDRPEIPTDIHLSIYPNPFNGTARIRFDLAVSGEAILSVFDVHGRRVRELSNGFFSAGSHELSWLADGLPSGMYWIRFSTLENILVQKALLIR